MLADMAEHLLRFHGCGSEETIKHIVGVLRLAEGSATPVRPVEAVLVDEQAERRRMKDRERKRAARSGEATPAVMSAEIEGQSADSETPSPPLLSPFGNPLITPTPSKKQKPQALPIDWKPNADHRRLAVELGFGEQKLLVEAARMSAWAASKTEKRTDWDAFFDFWLRNGEPRAFKSPALSSKVVSFSDAQRAPRVKMVFVAEGTPQWEAWVAAGHKKSFKTFVRGDAGWHFHSEWPPAAASQA